MDACDQQHPQSMQAFNTYELCVQNSGCLIDDFTIDERCAIENCAQERQICFGGPLPQGQSSCTALADCVQNCPAGDQVCPDDCIADASPASYADYFMLVECGELNSCDPMSGTEASKQCLREFCQTDWDACHGDTNNQGFCGDGAQGPMEECDDGNQNNGDGCSADCRLEGDGLAVCGDGVIEGNETCDDGNNVTESCEYGIADCMVCGADCREVPGGLRFCGDGVNDPEEECDDGNIIDDDTCSRDQVDGR